MVVPLSPHPSSFTRIMLSLIIFLSLMSTGHLLRLTQCPDQEKEQLLTIVNKTNVSDEEITLANFRIFIHRINNMRIHHGTQAIPTNRLKYLYMLLITTANDINLNPGPESTVFLCGTCDESLTCVTPVTSGIIPPVNLSTRKPITC